MIPSTFRGLPLHPLVVHFAVVLLPVCAVLLVVLVLVPAWRRRFLPLVMAGLVAATGASLVAKETGEQLAHRMGEPRRHAQYGDLVPVAAITLLVTSVLWAFLHWRADRRSASGDEAGAGVPGALAGLFTVLAAVGAVVLTYLAGHTGAQAAWAGRVPSARPSVTVSATPTPSSTPSASSTASGAQTVSPTPSQSASAAPTSPAASSPSATATTFTMAQVAQHATASSCWAAIDGSVYDLTDWINQHPGGADRITAICGTDATAAFNAQHQGQTEPAADLARFKIGTLQG